MEMIEARVKELEKAIDALIEERDAYHEENERLREALQKICRVFDYAHPDRYEPDIKGMIKEALSKDKVIFFDKVKDEFISCNIESCFYFDEKHEQNCCYSIPEKCCYRKISKDKEEV
jgi:regulator of replication initiation timing